MVCCRVTVSSILLVCVVSPSCVWVYVWFLRLVGVLWMGVSPASVMNFEWCLSCVLSIPVLLSDV